jgi:hypothetical protein
MRTRENGGKVAERWSEEQLGTRTGRVRGWSEVDEEGTLLLRKERSRRQSPLVSEYVLHMSQWLRFRRGFKRPDQANFPYGYHAFSFLVTGSQVTQTPVCKSREHANAMPTSKAMHFDSMNHASYASKIAEGYRTRPNRTLSIVTIDHITKDSE